MNQKRRILVTAVGGDLGQTIVKALCLDKKTCAIYGCDADPNGVGPAFADKFDVVPRADDPQYVGVLDSLCRALGANAVIPASEQEIDVLASLGRLPGGTPVICQPAEFVRTYGDKLLCMERLSMKVELAPFADGNDATYLYRLLEQVGFPVVVKSRRSSGSRTVQVAHNWIELCQALDRTGQPLVQAVLTGEEYSVGVFACDAFTTALAFRRTLAPGAGCTWEAEVDLDQEVTDYALRIAEISDLRGSINVQARKTPDGVRLLEVNPRFSSLAAARAACGLRDVEWSVDVALGELPELSRIRAGRFHRFYHEVMDFGDGYRALPQWAPRGAR